VINLSFLYSTVEGFLFLQMFKWFKKDIPLKRPLFLLFLQVILAIIANIFLLEIIQNGIVLSIFIFISLQITFLILKKKEGLKQND
jgi:hypothetical protein